MLLGSKAGFTACHASSVYILNSDKVLGDFFHCYWEFLSVIVIKLLKEAANVALNVCADEGGN